jgi:plastocyanin
MLFNKYLSVGIMLFLSVMIAAGAAASDVAGTVNDDGGKSAQDAVVYLLPADGKAPEVKKNTFGIMDQIKMQFVPRVLPVQTGTQVKFPNSDNILHHVYSFSPAKKFELPLYKGKTADPVLFDKPGVVVLGCNIHDWMIGYILVVDTPYFAKTGKDGHYSISGVPPGDYRAFAWHPDMKGAPESVAKSVKVAKSDDAKVDFSMKLKTKKKSSGGDMGNMNQY